MNILIAQLAHISPSTKVLDKYLKNAFKVQKKIDLVVLGEYVANKFFKEYRTKSTLKREFEANKKYFLGLAKKYKTTIVAPVIEWEFAKSKGDSKGKSVRDLEGEYSGEKFYKSIAVFNSQNVQFYRATRLMDFPHWNERAFFDNAQKAQEPLIFSVGDFKVSVIFGWEAHFDEIMTKLRKKGVDILCVPCANTFGSNARWQRLMQTRAFLNSCFIVRVNRTGEFVDESGAWEFYGESFIALPDGSLGDMMGGQEGILISEIEKENLEEIKNLWQFR